MQIVIDSSTTPAQLSAIAGALLALAGGQAVTADQHLERAAGHVTEANKLTQGEVAEKEAAPVEEEKPKRTRAPKAEPKVAPEAEPDAEPEPEVEKAKVDYTALRAETRELFAAYAEEAGTAKGLALLKEFQVSKFKDLEDGQLSDMRARLLELGE